MATVNQMIETACTLVGQPYLWGGNGETLEDIIRTYAGSKGQGKSATDDMIKFLRNMIPVSLSNIHFQDCSGFVVETLRKIGAIKKTWDGTAEDIFNKCQRIEKPCKGAFAFYWNGYKHNHIGICLDDTTVIHCLSVNTGVIIEPIQKRKDKWVDFGLPTWCIDFSFDTVTLKNNVFVYRTAQDAETKPTTATKVEYAKGDYFIYKTHGNCVNISKRKDVAGGWISNSDLRSAT